MKTLVLKNFDFPQELNDTRHLQAVLCVKGTQFLASQRYPPLKMGAFLRSETVSK